MKVIKKTEKYTIYQKRSGRYAVQGESRSWINAAEKVAILSAEDLIKAPASKVADAEAPAADETIAEETSAADETEA